jgi:hypothetical protein
MTTLSRVLDKTWQKLVPEYHLVLGSSPDGRFVAAQWGQVDGAGHAAVWEVATKTRLAG